MIVPIIPVWMVKATLDKIIGVLAMRRSWMTAVQAVNMPGLEALVPVRQRTLALARGS
jgi:hypothetical protein